MQFEGSARQGFGNELNNRMTVTKDDDDSAKLMDGRGGNDILVAAEGDDRLFGGEDADVLFGNGGNDTLAAGATGILAVQIAKLLGCEAWGIAGGAEKCAYLKDELGIAGAVDYKAADVGAQLDAAGGFDVYFDNVGGPLLDTVLTRMNHYGRVAVCGLLADYSSGHRTAPAEFDQVLMRRLRIEGFFSPDFMHEGPALTERLRSWHEAGDLVMPYDVTHSLENTLTAYAKLFTGANIGKVIVELDAA
ncbi:MAG: zinc-binding dehydrogenase [Sphingomonadales bacterium]|nr:zinc-binding dehydrogenase [Sphingomonadales bacterium]